ncbi:hypothetical protein WR25_09938 [Diploscapter pachys]|uniref:Uncharacterized protein n=1 Tax=Diploscapter pachys TaxID=2018661 RepID=A0A2A2J1Z9_9BILA|nr:hypothetical protein WR25_09938 [Diploscapter pachys]
MSNGSKGWKRKAPFGESSDWKRPFVRAFPVKGSQSFSNEPPPSPVSSSTYPLTSIMNTMKKKDIFSPSSDKTSKLNDIIMSGDQNLEKKDAPLPDFLNRLSSPDDCLLYLFKKVSSDDSLPNAAKWQILDSAICKWPSHIRLAYHKWRFANTTVKEVANLFKGESDSIKKIVSDLFKMHKGELELFCSLLSAMQASFSNEHLVSDFIQAVCLRPNYIDLLTQAARNKPLIFNLEWQADGMSDPSHFTIKVKPVSSPALETFLRLVAGENNFSARNQPLQLIGQQLQNSACGLKLTVMEANLDALFTKAGEVECRDVVCFEYSETEKKLILHFCYNRAEKEVLVLNAIPVGEIVECQVNENMDFEKGSLTLHKVEITE